MQQPCNLVLYIDGVELPTSPNADVMYKADSFEIPPSICAVAMKCDVSNLSANGFCMASSDNGYVTDDTWRCTIAFEEGWYEVDYGDSSWPAAFTVVTNEEHGLFPTWAGSGRYYRRCLLAGGVIHAQPSDHILQGSHLLATTSTSSV